MAASPKRKYFKTTSSNKAKRVSFQDLNDPFEQQEVNKHTMDVNALVTQTGKTTGYTKSETQKVRKWNDDKEYERREKTKMSSVEISELFTRTDLNLKSSTTPQTEEAKIRTPRKPKISTLQTPVVRKAEKMPPFKHPTEPLSHALLRTMSHRDSIATRRSLPKLIVLGSDARLTVSENKKVLMQKLYKMKDEQLMKSPGDGDDAFKRHPESHEEVVSIVRPADSSPLRIDIRCDVCRKEHKVNPASGFCKFCDEFLCAKCIHVHKSRVTRCHPVIVFHCDTCKELNILNRRGAGFCVKCKRYYCSVCVVQHCSRTNHDVLEGDDLLDVVEATTQVST